jgi:predicted kinase
VTTRPDQPQPAGDRPALSDRPAPWSRESLRERLDRLPDWHPSSPAQQDPPGGHEENAPDGPRARPEPLTDAQHEDRLQHIRDRLDWARDHDLATDQQHLADPKRGIWSKDRRDVHDAIVDDFLESASGVPCEHEAIMAGGLGGAGKSTVLDGHAAIERARYLTINPDGIKEAMASRGLIPELGDLSPMEASDLVHEESSHVAKLLAGRAMRDGKNIIWDITMSSASSTEQRLSDLDQAGYSVKGIFVDIGIDVAVRRADTRHRQGHEDYRAGIGFGGRYVPPEVIEAQADQEWGSINRRTFEQVKSWFADWAVYDNSVTGRDPELKQAGNSRSQEEER